MKGEADKKEVDKGIHLLEESICEYTCMYVRMYKVLYYIMFNIMDFATIFTCCCDVICYVTMNRNMMFSMMSRCSYYS